MGTATRAAYGHVLKTEVYKNPNVVVLEADLGNATKSNAHAYSAEYDGY